ncbi:hypothetical protein [Aeromonas molluscorum]|uniref:Uncharacterized protein n=1 Tax=Aeromonas molluscorum 848 TaxID=1268236 RepID=R1F6G9_9GAMM|nr:hypothetical protein [Aeromonas molluscorum]EOD55362.1 hypothetical protein G113_09310 [Aeromonas molluscorum 848]
MKASELVGKDGIFWLQPPAGRFYPVMVGLLLLSLGAVGIALWQGYPQMGLLPWVGVIFGGIVLLMMLVPRHWQAWRMAELAWDAEHLYLINGSQDRAKAVSRAALIEVDRERRVGHNGEWLAFSLDLAMAQDDIDEATEVLGLGGEPAHEISPGIYRFGFKRAWHSRSALGRILAKLVSNQAD